MSTFKKLCFVIYFTINLENDQNVEKVMSEGNLEENQLNKEQDRFANVDVDIKHEHGFYEQQRLKEK